MNGTWPGMVVIGMCLVAPGVRAEQAAQPVPAAPVQPSAPEAMAEPSAQQVSQAIRDYIAMIEEDEGSFTLEDEVTGKTRTLTLEGVQEPMTKTEDGLYRSCVNMHDKDGGDALDVDFDVESYDGELEVVDAVIHKVNGQARPAATEDYGASVPSTP